MSRRSPESTTAPTAPAAARTGSPPSKQQRVHRLPDGAPDTQRELAPFGPVSVQVRIDSVPWELPIDTLVISVGRGMGQLGAAVQSAFPGAAWDSVDLRRATPDKPQLFVLPPDSAAVRGSSLERVILASVRDGDVPSSTYAEAPATLESVNRAAAAAVDLALTVGTRALGMPLLGAGAVGMPASEVAFEVVSGVRRVLRDLGSAPLTSLVFVSRDAPTARAIERVWGYQGILAQATTTALSSPVVLADVGGAGLTVDHLRDVLDLPEEVLWQPCLKELSELRRLDREMDDLRATLVGPLDVVLDEPPGTAASSGTSGHGPASGTSHAPEPAGGVEETLDQHPRWRELTATREATLARLKDAVLRESVMPRLRKAINEGAERHRRTTLDGARAEFRRGLTPVNMAGLRGRPRPGALVHTQAHEELAALIDPARASRASLGVAGPRGCGKSTLLHEVTDGWSRGLSILVPAPASYASREFLLHLYGKICEAVLEKDPDSRVRLRETPALRTRLRSTSLTHLVVVPALVMVVGVAAISSSGVWDAGARDGLRLAAGALLVACGVPYGLLSLSPLARRLVLPRGAPVPRLLLHDRLRWRSPGPQRLLLTSLAVSVVVLAASSGLLTGQQTVGMGLVVAAVGTSVWWPRVGGEGGSGVPEGTSRPGLASTAATGPGPTAGEAVLGTHLRVSRRSAAMLALAAAQLTLAIAGAGLVLAGPRAAAVDSRLVVGAVLLAAGLAAIVPGAAWHSALDTQLVLDAAPPSDPASYRARLDLDKIRHQRSVSSGWTSSVKVAASSWLPFGVDVGATGGTTEAEVPLSVPELVEGIKLLLPSRGPAVLAIDELDKIESVQEARDFLNEIKGILEAQDTRCLVSMSEDAIARFERRGLPFRDVFDSAFDEVVRVPYLSALQARDLLNQRVTGVPEPFLGLAFCLSGGLPRDLLRAAERMISMVPAEGPETPMATVAREVVHRDMAGKIEAVTAGMKSIVVEPQVSALLRSIKAIDVCVPELPRRERCILDDAWLEGVGGLAPIVGTGQVTELTERRELIRLGVELVGYLYYSRTMLELFRTDTDEEADRLADIVRHDGGRRLDALARARQNFSLNPYVAWSQLDTLRHEVGLVPFGLPQPFVVGGATA